MESIFYCAKKQGEIFAWWEDLCREFIRQQGNVVISKDLLNLWNLRMQKINKNKILYLATGSQGEPMGAMNRIINGVHPEVSLESGDCVIFSSKIIPGNEKNYIIYKI